MELERSAEWEALSQNHLEGRTAAFFCYRDRGADELGDDGRPRSLRHKRYFDPGAEPFADMREAYAPLVWQCRYSGVEVPDALWAYADTGVGKPCSLNQAEHLEADAYARFDRWVDTFAAFVAAQGEGPAGRAPGLRPQGARAPAGGCEAGLAGRPPALRQGPGGVVAGGPARAAPSARREKRARVG